MNPVHSPNAAPGGARTVNEPGRAKPCHPARVPAAVHPTPGSAGRSKADVFGNAARDLLEGLHGEPKPINEGGLGGGPASPAARQRGGAAGGPQQGLSKLHIPSLQARTGELVVYRGASLLKLKLDGGRTYSTPPKRKEIGKFSDNSRRRLMLTMAKLERSQPLPLFVTLTYPDSFPTYHEDYKRHLELFWQRVRRRWPEASILWKLEFQERKSGTNKGKVAPHYHLFVYGVPERFAFQKERGKNYRLEFQPLTGRTITGTWMERLFVDDYDQWTGFETVRFHCPDGHQNPVGLSAANPEDYLEEHTTDSLKRWVSRTWFDIVGSRNFKHWQAGTRVERLKSLQGGFAYAAKGYISKQELMPKLEQKPGRFWGLMGRANAKLGKRELLELTERQTFQLRRFLRRHRRATTPPEKRFQLRKGGLVSQSFTVNAFCDVEFWLGRLEQLVGKLPEPDSLPRPVSMFAQWLKSLPLVMPPEQPAPSSAAPPRNVPNPFRPSVMSWLAASAPAD